jgi:hypothetical protein
MPGKGCCVWPTLGGKLINKQTCAIMTVISAVTLLFVILISPPLGLKYEKVNKDCSHNTHFSMTKYHNKAPKFLHRG